MGTRPLALPVDYYELLNLAPAHLFPVLPQQVHGRGRAPEPQRLPSELLAPSAVDEAAILAERNASGDPALSPSARAVRLLEIEIGRRILRDPSRRNRYDALRITPGGAASRGDRLQALRELQQQVRDEIHREQGDPLAVADETSAYALGMAALMSGDYAQAREILRRAAAIQHDAATVQLAFVRATIAASDPLTLGEYVLRELAQALERAASAPEAHALRHLVHGLQARERGDRFGARKAFQAAVAQQANLAPAWHGLAAVELADQRFEAALEAAQQACNTDPRNQAAWSILAVAALRLRRRDRAIQAAGQIANLRGDPWTAAQVLRELGAA
ncbi:MAG: hypothetical protein HC822_20755 [Oscillochloris sp.]|nr:hypothetical protein [Oscillochloris sp.]